MSEASEESSSSAQAASESNAQAAESNASASAQAAASAQESQQGESNQDGETLSLEEARKLREENRKLRQRAKDAEGKLSAQESADDQALTELEKATRERDSYKARLETIEKGVRTDRANAEAISLAAKSGAIDAGAIARLIPADAIEFGDDGKPSNVAELVTQAKKDYPTLFRAAAGSGNGASKDAETEAGTPLSRLERAYGKK